MHIPAARIIPRTLRVLPLIAALVLTVLMALTTGDTALAQTPPGTGVRFVNAGRDVVERRDDGSFIARPVFNRQVAVLHYGLRDADTGAWLTGVYLVSGGERQLAHGWEYSFEYPNLAVQSALDPEEAYLLVLLAGVAPGSPFATHHAVVPIFQPDNIWDRMLAALDPERWARAAAAWVIQGVHGSLCGVVERAVGGETRNCEGG